jgi:hypothetical protein
MPTHEHMNRTKPPCFSNINKNYAYANMHMRTPYIHGTFLTITVTVTVTMDSDFDDVKQGKDSGSLQFIEEGKNSGSLQFIE